MVCQLLSDRLQSLFKEENLFPFLSTLGVKSVDGKQKICSVNTKYSLQFAIENVWQSRINKSETKWYK